MKKIGIFLMLIVILSSCSKVMDLHPFDKLSPETAFQTENDLKMYANSFYLILPTGSEMVRGDAMTDYLAARTVPEYLRESGFSATQSSGWDWTELRNINFFLENSHQADVREEVRNHYDAVARFFRAWFYFEKVQRFGNVPIYDRTLDVQDPDLYKTQNSRDDVMAFILADLDYAIANLRDTKDVSASTITSWVALAFKSRVALFEGAFRKYNEQLGLSGADQWLQAAASAAKSLMDGGQYTLNQGNPSSSYRDLFVSQNPLSNEVILAWVGSMSFRIFHDANWYYTSATYGSRLSFTKTFINTYLNADGSRYTDQANYNTKVFFDEVAGRDPRLAQTIRTPGYRREGVEVAPDFTYTYTGYQPYKITLDSRTTDGRAENTNALPVLRYAEVLLNYAEARAELGQFDQNDWDQTIGLLRQRAGLGNTEMPASADPYLIANYFPEITQAALLEIRRERGIELALEGFRFYDLVRWNKGKLLESTFDGMYVEQMNELIDLNQDGTADVSFVLQIPDNRIPGVYYYLIDGQQTKLSEGDHGQLIWLDNIPRVWAPHKVFYPIPYNELVINPNLVQNPGWN